MNTKPKVGRPSAKLVYPEGTFTVKQLHAMNRKKVEWELSIRQHIERNIAKRYIVKDKAKVHTGTVGKPADLFRLTKWGMAKLPVKASKTPEPVVEVSVKEIVAVPAESQPAVVLPQNTPENIVNATLEALTPVG